MSQKECTLNHIAIALAITFGALVVLTVTWFFYFNPIQTALADRQETSCRIVDIKFSCTTQQLAIGCSQRTTQTWQFVIDGKLKNLTETVDSYGRINDTLTCYWDGSSISFESSTSALVGPRLAISIIYIVTIGLWDILILMFAFPKRVRAGPIAKKTVQISPKLLPALEHIETPPPSYEVAIAS